MLTMSMHALCNSQHFECMTLQNLRVHIAMYSPQFGVRECYIGDEHQKDHDKFGCCPQEQKSHCEIPTVVWEVESVELRENTTNNKRFITKSMGAETLMYFIQDIHEVGLRLKYTQKP